MTSRTVLLPDVTSFGELLEYVCEWDHNTMTGRDAKRPVEPRYIPRLGEERNEIGPFCTMENVAGQPRRSMAVRATDLVLDAIRPRIVTPHDHLGFKIYGRPDGRALVILDHGYIIGSHWLAYIDAATIPAYPFAARDAATDIVRDEIKANGYDVMRHTNKEPYDVILQGFTRTRETHWQNVYHGPRVTIHADGSITR